MRGFAIGGQFGTIPLSLRAARPVALAHKGVAPRSTPPPPPSAQDERTASSLPSRLNSLCQSAPPSVWGFLYRSCVF